MRSLRHLRSLLLFMLFVVFCWVPLLTAQVVGSVPALSTSQTSFQWVSQGQSNYQSGQFAEAAAAWQQAADTFAQQHDSLNQAMALSNLSLTQQQLEQWEQARQSLTKSLALLSEQPKTSDQKRTLAATLDIQGQLQLSTGAFDSALETWRQAADLYRKTNNPQAIAVNQINQAQAMQSLGLYPRACQTLTDTLKLPSSLCDLGTGPDGVMLASPIAPSVQALGFRSLGSVFRIMGQSEKSRAALKQSLKLSENAADQAAAYLSLGNTARTQGNKTAAAASFTRSAAQPIDCLSDLQGTADNFYEQAEICYRQVVVNPTVALQARLNLLSLMVQTRQWQKLPDLLPAIQADLSTLPPSRTSVAAHLKFAQSLMCLHGMQADTATAHQSLSPVLQTCTASGDRSFNPSLTQNPGWDEVQQKLDIALKHSQALRDKRLEASALGYQGTLAQQMGNASEAQQLTEKALQQINAFSAPEQTYLWQWQLGKLYHLQGKPELAIASYGLAFNQLQSLRRDLVTSDSDLQFAFRDSIEPVYREFVALLLDSDAPSQAHLRQARDVIESLQLAELNNFFREACIDAHPQPIDQLDAKAAVIYSIVLPERIAVIRSLPGKPLGFYSTKIQASRDGNNDGKGEVENTVEQLLASLSPVADASTFLGPQQKVYDWLVRPIAAELEQSKIKTLVFVLDGILREVPVAALHDGKQYLIERYSIALTPGLELLQSRSFQPEKLRILAGGLSEARDGFASLPGVKQEVTEISAVFPTETLLNDSFTSLRLRQKIDSVPFPIVHLATHAQFSSRAEDTFLLTWSERVNVKNLDELLRERSNKGRHPIELLILSACQTAVGDNRATLGLAGVAVRSGARSTIATLWAVQDQSTADLMVQLYKALDLPHISKADALRQGQLALLHSPQFNHPYYWAAFVLVGNWT